MDEPWLYRFTPQCNRGLQARHRNKSSMNYDVDYSEKIEAILKGITLKEYESAASRQCKTCYELRAHLSYSPELTPEIFLLFLDLTRMFHEEKFC